MRDEKNDWRDGLQNAMYTLLLNSIDFHIILFILQAIFRRNCLV